MCCVPLQVIQVCAEHKKPKKLLKHMASIKALSAGQRNPPRTLVFAKPGLPSYPSTCIEGLHMVPMIAASTPRVHTWYV